LHVRRICIQRQGKFLHDEAQLPLAPILKKMFTSPEEADTVSGARSPFRSATANESRLPLLQRLPDRSKHSERVV
jgi:hypothetical protein